MNEKRLVILGLVLLSGWKAAIADEPARDVTVTVVKEQLNPVQPVAGVRVDLSFVDGSKKVTATNLKTTNPQGQMELSVSTEALGHDLTVEVSGVPGYVVYRPAGGLLLKVERTLKVGLVPKGSPALLEPAQLEAMLNRLSNQSLQIQQLKAALNKEKNEETPFDVALRAWAADHGLAYDELDTRMRQWSEDVLAHRSEASLVKQAEAELGLRHYEKAGILFQSAAAVSRTALHHDQESYLAGLRQDLRNEVQLDFKSASALQSARLFVEANNVSEDAKEEADVQHRHFPEDADIRHTWELTNLLALYARWKEAQQSLVQAPGQGGAQAFASIVTDAKHMVNQVNSADDPQLWLYLNGVVVVSMIYLSEVSNAADAQQLREQALTFMKSAVDGYDKRSDPGAWAQMEILDGLVLLANVARGTTDGHMSAQKALDLLTQAKSAFAATLEVYSRADRPSDWAQSKARLGDTLSLRALLNYSLGDKSTGTISEAEADYREALEATDKGTNPADWADLQGELAGLLANQARMADGPGAITLWQQAAATFRSQLEGLSKTDNPAKWANAEDALASALASEAELLSGQKAEQLYENALAAYRQVSEVFTKASFPQRWAKDQTELGQTLAKKVKADSPENASLDLKASEVAFKAALEIFTQEAYPQRWTAAEQGLAIVLGMEGARTSGDASRQLMLESASAYHALLAVYPKNSGLLSTLGQIYHEYLADFDKAYEIDQRREEEQPNVGNQLDLAEAALTDSKFTECISDLGSMDVSKLKPENIPVTRTLLFACQWGAGRLDIARQTAGSLAEYSAGLPKTHWTTNGDRAYLANAAEFSAGKDQWIKLFQGLQDGDGKSLSDAAHALAGMGGR